MTSSNPGLRSNVAALAASAISTVVDAVTKPKAVVALFTKDGGPLNMVLFVSTSANDRAPVYSGLLNDKRVSAFLRTTGKRPFLSIVDSEKGGDGKQVATGNFVVNPAGIPLLALRLEGSDKTAWVSVGKAISDEALIGMGVDPAKLHVPLAKRESVTA